MAIELFASELKSAILVILGCNNLRVIDHMLPPAAACDDNHYHQNLEPGETKLDELIRVSDDDTREGSLTKGPRAWDRTTHMHNSMFSPAIGLMLSGITTIRQAMFMRANIS